MFFSPTRSAKSKPDFIRERQADFCQRVAWSHDPAARQKIVKPFKAHLPIWELQRLPALLTWDSIPLQLQPNSPVNSTLLKPPFRQDNSIG
jgi:hypothetical protein